MPRGNCGPPRLWAVCSCSGKPDLRNHYGACLDVELGSSRGSCLEFFLLAFENKAHHNHSPNRRHQDGSGWREEPPPPKGMAQMSGTALDGVGYIIGQDGCFSFTPATGEWAELPSFPGGDLTAPHVAAHNGKVWAAMDNSSDATAFFSPEAQEWTAGPTAPTANGWGGAASVGGKLLLVSGAHKDELHGRVIFDDRCFVLRE